MKFFYQSYQKYLGSKYSKYQIHHALTCTSYKKKTCKSPAASSQYLVNLIGNGNDYLRPLHIINGILQSVIIFLSPVTGAQWLSGRVLDSRPKGRGFEPHRRHCVVVLEQDTFILAQYWFNPGRPVPHN